MSDEPIPAATLILVRERASGAPEILMVERAEGMAFAGGAMVFPGGRIDGGDRVLAQRLGADETGAAAVAAIRETLEETGVPAGLDPIPDASAAAALQDALVAGEELGELIAARGLRIELAALTAFARWVPKFHAVRRFDTLFFLASAASGEWQPRAMASENSSAMWISAAEALERDGNGTVRLIFPTRRNLERLAQHGSFAEMLADARAHHVKPITPWVEERGGERFITIPADAGYPVTQERLEGLWRG